MTYDDESACQEKPSQWKMDVYKKKIFTAENVSIYFAHILPLIFFAVVESTERRTFPTPLALNQTLHNKNKFCRSIQKLILYTIRLSIYNSESNQQTIEK